MSADVERRPTAGNHRAASSDQPGRAIESRLSQWTDSAPAVTGCLVVDLSALDPTDWYAVADRFSRVADAPAGAEILVKLPDGGLPVSFRYAFADWPSVSRVAFRVQGHTTAQTTRAVADLRQALGAHRVEDVA